MVQMDIPPLTEEVALRMKRQLRRDTACEMKIRRVLHANGYRYRVDVRPEPDLRCRADILFTRRRIAVFIDGCFWHACPEHGSWPRNNAEWWRNKITRNAGRDRENNSALVKKGWSVVRIWEHEDPETAVRKVTQLLDRSSAIG
jgi:DNA mismatch endonuclease, patch repair protein